MPGLDVKPGHELAALNALMDLNDQPDLVVRKSRRLALVYLIGGIAMLSGMAIWNKYLNDAAYIILSFGSGSLFALSYSKYVEAKVLRFIAPYLKKVDMAARQNFLRSKAEEAN